MATHSSILAWRIPWAEELGRLQSMGSQRVGHDWVTKHIHTKSNKWNQNVINFLAKQKFKSFLKCVYYLCYLYVCCCCCSVAQSCLTLCNPWTAACPGLPVPHHLPEFAQLHVHCISDAVLSSHPLSPPSPPAFHLSQHQGLFQGVGSFH